MFRALIDWTFSFRYKHYFRPGRVLEVGSRNVNGSVRLCFLDHAEYIGIDMEPGEWVDQVMRAEVVDMHFGRERFDTVLCYETLEHCPWPWQVTNAMREVLVPGGLCFITSPTFGFPLHRHPKDYYRFGEDAFREVLFEGFDVLELVEVKDPAGNPCLCGVGRKQ